MLDKVGLVNGHEIRQERFQIQKPRCSPGAGGGHKIAQHTEPR